MALSYPTIQRKVRTLNLTLGTKYSAREILNRQIEAEKRGATTNEYQMILGVKGTRADVKVSAQLEDDTARYYINEVFGNLGSRDPQVYALLHGRPSDFISPQGYVYTPIRDGDTVKYRNNVNGLTLSGLPAGAKPYTAKGAYDAIIKKRDEIDRTGAHRPTEAYDPVDLSDF